MRDYIEQEVQNHQSWGGMTLAVNVIQNWHQRKVLKQLLAMDEHALSDIGVKRQQLVRALKRPLVTNWRFERERDDKISNQG